MITLNNLYHICLTSGIHAIIFIIFMSILYFQVIIKLKHDIFIKLIVDGLKDYNVDKVDLSKIPKYESFLKLLKQEAEKEETENEKYNNQLKIKTVKIISVIIISYVLFMSIMPLIFNLKQFHIDMNTIIKEISLIILVVGTYEVLFMRYIVLEYSFYSFHKFLYDYITRNVSNIKRFLPSIIIHFMFDIPDYRTYIPNNIRNMLFVKGNEHLEKIKDDVTQKIENKLL